jgi:dynactin 1
VREVKRSRDAANEVIADHQATITKFRDLVARVQEQNLDLRAELEKETNKPVSATPAEMIDFKKMFTESRAHSKAIDMELRTCEVQQSCQHVSYLSSFMSDAFMGRGGDNEAVLVLLLVPRMIWKAEILIAQVSQQFWFILWSSQLGFVWYFTLSISLQVRENFAAPETIDKDGLLKGHDVEKYTFGAQLGHFLEALVTQLRQFQSALDTCSTETFLKMGTLYQEMSVHEKAGLDFYIELLRKSQLDENVPIENVEKSLQYFQHIYPLHLGAEKLDHPVFLTSHLKSITSAFEALSAEFTVAKVLLPAGQEATEMGTLIKTSEVEIVELKAICKGMRRRAADSASVSFPSSSALKFTDVCHALTPLVKALHAFGRSASQNAGLQGEATLPATKMSELLHSAIDKVYEFNENGLDTIKQALSTSSSKMGELSSALQEGEWDQDPTTPAARKNPPPVVLRAGEYKAEIKEAEGMKNKLDGKDGDMKELKMAVRGKVDELSEMQVSLIRISCILFAQSVTAVNTSHEIMRERKFESDNIPVLHCAFSFKVRKDKAEKKLLDSSRDSELVREKLQRKLDDAMALMKRKEKEFEETMDHLQSDIDNLESERGDLKNKLKDITKKTLIQGITQQAAAAAAGRTPTSPVAGGLPASLLSLQPMSLGPSVPMPVKVCMFDLYFFL